MSPRDPLPEHTPVGGVEPRDLPNAGTRPLPSAPRLGYDQILIPSRVRGSARARRPPPDCASHPSDPLTGRHTAHPDAHRTNPSREVRLGARVVLPGFEVIGQLKTGGMGVVYHARDLRLGREVR